MKQTAKANTLVDAQSVPSKKHQSKNSTIVRYAYDCSNVLSTHFQQQETILERISTTMQIAIIARMTITRGVMNLNT